MLYMITYQKIDMNSWKGYFKLPEMILINVIKKHCIECKQVFPIDTFPSAGKVKDVQYYKSYCKTCDMEKGRKWKLDNTEKFRCYMSKYGERMYPERRERILEKSKLYYMNNREERLEYGKRYHLQRKEKNNELNPVLYLLEFVYDM